MNVGLKSNTVICLKFMRVSREIPESVAEGSCLCKPLEACNVCEQASSLIKLNKSTQRDGLTDEELTLILQLTPSSAAPDFAWQPLLCFHGDISTLLRFNYL
jgi:hypothetical protein